MITLKKYLKKIIIVVICGTGFSALHAQKIQLQGVVQDTLTQPIFGANLIATPATDADKTVFSITDAQGRYKLQLTSGVPYAVQIISLGYATQIDSLVITSNTHKNYRMQPSVTTLQEVVVKAKLAVIVKEDTITYKVDKFRTGDERKLRDLLKKLPGVEVDNEGNVTVNGKQVNKLMVDGKPFFGGDTQLGVNNIPAGVVDEVTAIDDYHEVAFMKGLNNSDRLALNIRLKKGKKHFVFGETQVGGGVKERYFVNPTLFYYSPKTTVNFIGNLNNVNQNPLDVNDVRRFKSGAMSFTNSPINSSDAGLNQFSSTEDIRFKKMLFGAANLTQQINNKLRLSSYSIVAQQKTRSLETNHIEYLIQDNLVENRKSTAENKGFTNFNKLKLRYTPNLHTDMAYHLIASTSFGEYAQNLRSQLADSLNRTGTNKTPHNFELSQFFRWNSQPTYAHTSEIKANYTYKEKRSQTHWDFDRPVFSAIIPSVSDGERFNFHQNYSGITNTGRVNFKHYWVLNNTNHIYPKVGFYFFHQTYHSWDYQRLQDGSIHGFSSAGFNNALSYQLMDPYIGFQYKVKLGDIIFEPGLVYHHYMWQADQFDARITDETKGLFLPEFHGEYEISTTKKLELDYHLKASFAEASDYANRFRLISFNQLYRGNSTLENALYHELKLRFRNFSSFNKISYFLTLRYTHHEKSIRSATTLEGTDQVNTSMYTQFPENSYKFNGHLGKRWHWLRLRAGLSASLSDYSRMINTEKIRYNAQYFSCNLRATTTFEKGPNWTFGFRQNIRNLKSEQFSNNDWSAEPFAELDYAFLNGFILKAEYEYTYFNNQTSGDSNTYQLANASLYYRKEGSPWGFEIQGNNLFDVQYKRRYSYDEFLVFDQRVYIQPRTILFILSYQL